MRKVLIYTVGMTSFKKRVLEVVAGIPEGSVMSYGEVALRAGSPGASRAVGHIMANNFDVSVPCHRVVRSDGMIGGYNRGGSREKKKILKSEGVPFAGDQVKCFT